MAHVDAGKQLQQSVSFTITGKIHKIGETHEGIKMDWMEQEQKNAGRHHICRYNSTMGWSPR